MKKTFFCLLFLFAAGCEDSGNGSTNLDGKLRATQKFTGNIESVRAVPGQETPTALVVASKAKKACIVTFSGEKFNETDCLISGEIDADREFTNSAIIDSTHFAVTHTLLTKDASGKTTSCGGEVIFYDTETKKQTAVPVGSMPDCITISPDKTFAITADEHDSAADAWGKCSIEDIKPGISIIDLSKGIDNASVIKRVQFTKNTLGPREPEYVAIASDNDTVAVTLQDSHEIAIFSLKALLALDMPIIDENNEAIHIMALPQNKAGYNPWPDGIVAFDTKNNSYFAMAGEWNDTIIITDSTGKTSAVIEITEKEVPTSYPCTTDEDTVRYSPDSITSYTKNGKTYIAATLRYAGAVIIYDVTTPESPVFEKILKAGENDKTACDKTGSTVYPEGLSAADGYIWTANEGDDSVTILSI